MVTQSGGRFIGTFQVDPGPAGADLRRLIELLEMLLSWLWYHRQALYLIADNLDAWVNVGAWCWANRLVFHRAALVVIGLGEIVEATLECCAVVYDGWVWVWRPLGVIRGAV